MPFTSNPSHLAPTDSKTARAAAAVVADTGSHDSRLHSDERIRRECPVCHALPHERCVAARYASGRARVFARDFHPGR